MQDREPQDYHSDPDLSSNEIVSVANKIVSAQLLYCLYVVENQN